MAWDIRFIDQFEAWWHQLSGEQQEQITAAVEVLEEKGPALGRPLVDTMKTSRFRNMKELRVSKGGALRILFIFDPLRRALLLLGGNKEGAWDEWYREMVPRADALYEEYLRELKAEGELR
jgi:hypothetical protein